MKTVVICGSHPKTRSDAPFDNTEYDFWVFNEAGNQTGGIEATTGAWVKKIDAVFQMHNWAVYTNPENRSDKNHWDWLKEPHDFPIYMQKMDPLVPACVPYPLDEVCKCVDNLIQEGSGIQYFTSSIAYALGLAIYKGYERILIYGIEMSSDTEYYYQRDCFNFWLGVALGKGIQVEMHSGADILRKPLYGYDCNIEQHIDDLNTRKLELIRLVREAREKKNALELVWQSSCDDFVDIRNVGDALSEYLDSVIDFAKQEGKLHDIKSYIYKVEQMERGIIDRNEFEQNARICNKRAEETKIEIYRTAGMLDYVFSVYEQTKNPIAMQQIKEFAGKNIKVGYESGFEQGRFEENTRLLNDLDERIRAAGGSKSLEVLKG